MAQVEILLPKMGESVNEATIVEWLKEEGDAIEEDEFIVNIATDKVDNEIPSEYEGILVKKLFNEGDVVTVGQAFAIIETNAEVEISVTEPEVEIVGENISQAVENTVSNNEPVEMDVVEISKTDSNGRFYSPLVRSIAKKENIGQAELTAIQGTGLNLRVTKSDMVSYIENRDSMPKTKPEPEVNTEAASPTPSPTPKIQVDKVNVPVYEGDEIIEMDRMRKLIANHMVMSKQTSPHVTSYVEADVTNIVHWRNKIKDEFLKREGEKITYTPIFMEAVIKAIKDFPMVNVSVDGTTIVKHKDINLGMATALPSGNLIVPVIKNADQYSLIGLTKQVNSLVQKARNNKLKPDDIAGGTYTITNVGTFGNIMGTPIINQPQVAILAVGIIRKKPVVIETPQGDVIGIRHMMYLSHAYDHRVVDGALGGMFVKRVADYLENFELNRDI
jgi:2-oxoglutarate dehydrogenase E2 component (dihydrolipoamide succinyltransferase)